MGDAFGGAIVGNPDQHHEPGLPLDERCDLRFIALAKDEITLPAAGHGPVLGLGRALTDGDHVRDLPPGLGGPGRADPTRTAGTQRQLELRAQLPTRLQKQRLVHRLGGHTHIRSSVSFLQFTADLLR